MIWDDVPFVQMVAYGNAEQRFFRDHRHLFDVVTLPGTVATFFQQGAGGFVLALKKPYFIDPRTSVLQSRIQLEGRQEPRHVRLAAVHGPRAAAIFAERSIRVEDLDQGFRREMLEAMLDFQIRYAESSSQKLSEYMRILGQEPETEPLSPHWLTPPYFRASTYGDDWYHASLDMAQQAVRQRLALPVVPVICIRKEALGDARNIARDWSEGFVARLLWVDKLDGYRDEAEELNHFLQLIRALTEGGGLIFNLFGDYFSILAMKVGLSGVGHGVGYGESREALARVGGLPAERYYLPALHRFYPPADAELILQLAAEAADERLVCDCRVCEPYRDDNVLAVSRMSRDDMLAHFLIKRREEIKHAASTSLRQLVEELEGALDVARAVVARLPASSGVQVDHLDRWRQALADYT